MTVLEAVNQQLTPATIFNDRLAIGRKKIERLLSNMRFDPETGCWIWIRALVKGYGVVKLRCLSDSILPVHRVCHELAYGPVAKDLHVHHQVEAPVCCSGRSCGNPDHTKPVGVREHIVDLTPGTASNIAAHRNTCAAGHAYTVENTRIVKDGTRQCRACDKIRKQEARDLARMMPRHAKDPAKIKDRCFRGHILEGDNIRIVNAAAGQRRVCLACEEFRDGIHGVRCKRGHVMAGDNVYLHPGGNRRTCLACRKLHFTKHGDEKDPSVASIPVDGAYAYDPEVHGGIVI